MVTALIKYRYLILAMVIISTFFLGTKASLIEVNADSSQYFHKNDSDYAFYEKIKSEIKVEENLVLLGIKNEEGVFNSSFIVKVQNLLDSLKLISNVKKVKGITNASYPVKTLLGLISVPYLNIDDSTNLMSYKKKIFKDFEVTQNFINQDGKVLFIWIELEEGMNKGQLNKVINEIDELRNSFSELPIFLWGRKYLEFSFKKLLSKEFKGFIFWIFLFLFLALIFIFRSPLAILFPVFLVLISIVIFLGLMVLLKRPLGIMSSVFPTIVLIVGVSDVIHMAIKFNQECENGESANSATRTTLREIGWTTFITSFTTAAGFITLCISPMKAMKDFGLEAAFVVMLTYLLTLLLLPVFFISDKRQGLFSINKHFEKFFSWIYKKTKRIQAYPKQILITYGFLLIIGMIGISLINTNSMEYKIPKDSQLRADHTFFEENFGGSRTFELILIAGENYKLNDPEMLKLVFEVHNYLSELPYLKSLKSPVLYYRAVHRTLYPSKEAFSSINFDEKSILKSEKLFSGYTRDNYLFNRQMTVFKFNAQMKLLGSHEMDVINKEIMSHVNQLIYGAPIEARISGMAFLMDLAQKKSISNMLIGLLLAIFIVAFTLGIIFKNWGLMLLTLLLNFIPISIAAGIIGFSNVELRAEILLVFTIGFVVAVDDTIHLLSKFQWERRRGRTVEEAIYMAQLECGKAIFATSLILMGGFFILIKSTTVTISTLGFFIGTIIFIALSVNLILAPILVLKWFKNSL